MPLVCLTWPKCRKLTQRAEYTACYDKGTRHYTRYFVVFARGENRPPFGRLGLAVTRKCGNAVQRNRIKRVLREFFRLHQHDMPAMDIVVTPKRHLRADMLDLALAERELAPLLAQLRRSFPPQAAGPASNPCDTAGHTPETRSGSGGVTSGSSSLEGGTA